MSRAGFEEEVFWLVLFTGSKRPISPADKKIQIPPQVFSSPPV
jgi:hypothetical protein